MLNDILTIARVAMASCLLSACAIVPLPDMTRYGRDYLIQEPGYRLHPGKNAGLVVGSVTRTHETGDARFYFSDAAGKRVGFVDSIYNPVPKVWYEDFVVRIKNMTIPPYFYGQLFVLQLPPGNYYFGSWRDGQNTIFENVPSAELSPPWQFMVKRGEINYIGNLHLVVIATGGMTGGAKQARAEIRDETQRDIAIFREDYTGLKDIKLKNICLNR